MPHYTYTARSADGRREEGLVEAPDRRGALRAVEQRGLVPVRLEEAAAGAVARAVRAGRPRGGWRRQRMGRRELLLFTRELSDLLGSGMTLGGSLHTLAQHRSGGERDRVVEILRDRIVQGNSLSESLAERPDIFPPLYVSMTRAGEAGGALAEALERLAVHYERVGEAREKVLMALVYPGIVLTIGVFTMVFIMIFVIPRFAALFAELGSTLPLPTRMLIGASRFLTGWRALWIAAPVVAAVVLGRRALRTPAGRFAWDRALLRLPVVRRIVAANAYAHFAQTLGSLLANGVPVLQALAIVEETVGNTVIAGELREARARVTDGSSISGPLAAGRVFPTMLTDMLAVGERTGDMSGALGQIARRYNAELDRSVKVFTTLLEPLLIVLMAGLVGFVAISMLLAVFDLTSGLNV